MKALLKFTKVKIRLISVVAILLIALPLFCYWQNNGIVTTKLVLSDISLPKGFDNFKIMHVSDLHNKLFGTNENNIIKRIKLAEPDIIVITGDLIDKRRTDIDAAMLFITEAVKISPVYYVTGNHEAWSGVYPKLKDLLIQANVIVLDDDSTIIENNNDRLAVLGLKDFSFLNYYSVINPNKQFEQTLSKLKENSTADYTILLSHRPEKFDIYSKQNVNLVFCGHAHGGQVRLPLIGGLASPDQGILPKYTSGIYKSGVTSMVVSRGLGNSIFPQRVFNRPELVLLTLKTN